MSIDELLMVSAIETQEYNRPVTPLMRRGMEAVVMSISHHLDDAGLAEAASVVRSILEGKE